tara:strand:+ start:5146 stop:5460 length:315 start_codon:yes stop_codon:yes gene_type:complete
MITFEKWRESAIRQKPEQTEQILNRKVYILGEYPGGYWIGMTIAALGVPVYHVMTVDSIDVESLPSVYDAGERILESLHEAEELLYGWCRQNHPAALQADTGQA